MLKINHFTKLFFSGILLLCFSGAFAQEQEDRLLQLMKRELAYSMEQLKKQESVPYYMNLRAMGRPHDNGREFIRGRDYL